MAHIKFYRGTSTNYDTTTHANCVYFCTDTKELKLDGNSYGISDANLSLLLASVKSVSVAGNVLTFTFNNGSTGALTLPTVTSSSAGVMSAADKTKLDGIAANANNYSLPTASSTTLGGVKTGTNITNNSGIISITKNNVTNALGYTPPTKDTTYSVMTGATSSAAGSTGLVPAPSAGD